MVKGRKSHDNFRNQLYSDAFGEDVDVTPDLSNFELHADRGYFSQNSFMSILLLTGCMLTCTCPRGKWLPFVIGNAILAEDDKRLVIPEEGMMTCEVREKEFKSENSSIKLACIAFRTGTGNVVMVCSTTHRRLKMDFVTATEGIGTLWHDNREGLRRRHSR